MWITSLLLCLLIPRVSSLPSPVRGQNGELDLDRIINHLTLLGQTVQEIPTTKTELAVLVAELQASEPEIARLTTDLNRCTTNLAVVKHKVESLERVKETCEDIKNKVSNLTNTEETLQEQLTSLHVVLADVCKSASDSNSLNSIHDVHDMVHRSQADNDISVYDTRVDNSTSIPLRETVNVEQVCYYIQEGRFVEL